MNKDTFIDVVKRYPIATVGFVVLLAAIVTLFVRGDLATALEAREVELNAEINVLEANAKNSLNLNDEVDALEALVNEIDSRLFNPEQRAVNTNFFYSLENLADIQMRGVNAVQDVDPTLAKKGPNELKLFDHLIYDLAIEGSYQSVVTFIEKVQKVNAFLRITSLQLSPSNTLAEGTPVYLARIRVVVLAIKTS